MKVSVEGVYPWEPCYLRLLYVTESLAECGFILGEAILVPAAMAPAAASCRFGLELDFRDLFKRS